MNAENRALRSELDIINLTQSNKNDGNRTNFGSNSTGLNN